MTSSPNPLSWLRWLVFISVVPAWVITAWIIAASYEHERDMLVNSTTGTARALMRAVERDLAGAQATLEVLATSPYLASGDLAAFHRQAREVLARQPGNGIVLADGAEQQVMSTLVPHGTPLPRSGIPHIVRRIVDNATPVAADFYIGATSKRPQVAVGVPVFQDGKVVYALTMGFVPERLGKLLLVDTLPPGSVAAILDSKGTIVARTQAAEQFVGQKSSPALLQRMAETAEGVVETVNKEGIPVLVSFSRSAVSGWTVAIGIPLAELTAQLRTVLWWSIGAAGILFLIGFYVPRLISLRLERAIRADLAAASEKQRALETQAAQKIRTQLEHLSLLDQITRSTGERLDLKSIFQIVLGRLEDSLPVDFGCVCLYDAAANTLRVASVGAKSAALARELTLDEHAAIDIDQNGLARCIQGHLVYEPDIGEVRFPFPARLARGGLGSLVMAPLKSESRVFGVLIAAQREAQAFSSPECEFLRQLSEHVALAAHQAQLYTSLQQAYDDLRQTQAAVMQEERLRALGQMASGIAHDINNALSPVSLYVESLLEKEPDLSARARGYLETIQRAVEDVAQTVARLREFYRQREQQLELAPVQMNSLAQQVLDLTRARWRDMPQERGIAIHALTELAPDLPEVMGVESEIREALTNLVFNAVDAMPEGGTLTLRTRRVDADAEHPAVAVEVVDTGAGMDEETRRRCLEPFFTTKGERGTGLGLAMVFGMVQRHSAELEIDSAPGAGTTVRLVFAVPAAVQTESGQPVTASEVPSGLRLLLIDDDPMLIKSLRDTLETDGHVIVTANGGEAGIAAFRAALARGERYAAVITDLGMPYVDGRQVATAVKEASRETPVILLTGWGQRLVADNDIPLNVDRVLAKPPKLRELREALAQLCQSTTTEPIA